MADLMPTLADKKAARKWAEEHGEGQSPEDTLSCLAGIMVERARCAALLREFNEGNSHTANELAAMIESGP